MFYEQWAGSEALESHRKMPYMKALGQKLKDRSEKGVLTFFELLK
jgi:quinol monooxygenase YgiN